MSLTNRSDASVIDPKSTSPCIFRIHGVALFHLFTTTAYIPVLRRFQRLTLGLSRAEGRMGVVATAAVRCSLNEESHGFRIAVLPGSGSAAPAAQAWSIQRHYSPRFPSKKYRADLETNRS